MPQPLALLPHCLCLGDIIFADSSQRNHLTAYSLALFSITEFRFLRHSASSSPVFS
ncbi:hypothetical protein K438DRAFT_1838685 [Mycena galopus ATCC 62051]|nr:hypothetical protein K438DRAFT_1838685 [Mycena galopus ATCC 62051]